MTDRIEHAARNDALWCDGVCRSHGISGTFDSAGWSSSVRTPPLHPDAVTLAQSTQASDLIHRIDASSGASVKDSWASLDLTAAGFAPLIDGQWLWLDPGGVATSAGDSREWRAIDTSAELTRWSRAWASKPDEATILGSPLLEEQGVHVLGTTDSHDDFVAGCIVNLTGEVAGISNVFAKDGDDARAWCGAAVAASTVASGLSLVGWESGDGVGAAQAAGFDTIGPLTVWIR